MSQIPHPWIKGFGYGIVGAAFIQDFICSNDASDDIYAANLELEQEKAAIYELINAN